jgi:hypothetical protein
MRSEIAETRFPSGKAIIGSDDVGAFTMIYFDERRVSRIYQVTVEDKCLTWRRDDPHISQTMTIVPAKGGTLQSKGVFQKMAALWATTSRGLYARVTSICG